MDDPTVRVSPSWERESTGGEAGLGESAGHGSDAFS